MAEENLKVAVRVRPFNQREKDANASLCVAMSGNQTIITNPKTKEEKKYAYDFSYWSFDGFKTDANGYMIPEGTKYADQKKVYNDLGVGVLKNAWEGYNASLFAYGQTGSGKSYSVVGYGANKGIVPMVCEDIFNTSKTIKDKTIEVTFSMSEIYSEVVRDLLVKPDAGGKKAGLEVRQDPKNGFFAQGLKKCMVGSFDEISKLMDQGTANRTIASTNMNATSSRAHTIVALDIIQKYKNAAGAEMTKSAIINLVDLAGSERQDQTGATGDRLKEGAAINLSLTSLGNVISALADQSAGKNTKVPYRDSVLTKLLMNALGGNCKTIMIAAISPAEINFDESVSTLRYADRAKQIKTKAVVNEDPTEKLIKSLQEENARLKKMLETGGKLDVPSGDAAKDSKADQDEEAALKKQLEENNKAMENMQKSYEEKLKQAQEQNKNIIDSSGGASKVIEKSKTVPHLRNVNMDSTLSGMIRFLLEGDGVKNIGSDPKSEVPLTGINILAKHATITAKGGKFTIQAMQGAKVVRNGYAVHDPTELVHLDRLLFGASQFYIFADPTKAKPNETYWTFELMQDEIAKANGVISKDNKNMTPEEIKCQSELVDLIPAVEEANSISTALDKKVFFSILPVSAAARGDVDGSFQAFISVRNFATGYEWLWPKNKFLDRKADFTGIYNDFKDDGIINTEKFKNYDPFFESPDTPFQIGTAIIYPKGAAYMLSNTAEYKVISLKSKEVATMTVEILPCNAAGKVVDPKDGIKIEKPEQELLNKNVSFMFNIKSMKNLDAKYEDVYCEFEMFGDKTIYKTNVIKSKNSSFDINFSKQFTFVATQDFLNYLLNKQIYVRIFAEQKHVTPTPEAMKISTKEYMDREKAKNGEVMIKGKDVLNNTVDPEKQKIADDLRIALAKGEKTEFTLNAVRRLAVVSQGNENIKASVLKSVLLAQNEAEVNKILEANKSATGSADALNDKTWNLGLFNITIRGDKKDEHADDPNKKKNKSSACSIQ